jgi:hypothetical protein
MSITPTIYAKARSEVLALFGWNADSLSPDQMLRLDCAVALRLALDDLQGRVVRGESVDMTRMLTASEALSRLLPPAALASPLPANSPDPREIMLRTYLEMRRRGAQFGLGYDGLKLENERLRAEIAALKAAGAPAPVEVSPPSAPAGGNVLTLSRPSPPPRPPSPSPAASAPVLGDLVMVCDPSPQEPWKSFVEPDGSIRATPFDGGKYWGPV